MASTTPRPRREPRLYTRAELEQELGKRLQAALKERRLDEQLQEISERLAAANHLKEEMVTKDEFRSWKAEIQEMLQSSVVVKPLGDGDYVVAIGGDHLTRAQIRALEVRAARDLADRNRLAERRQAEEESDSRLNRRLAGWQTWAAGGALFFGAIATALGIGAFLHSHHIGGF